MIKAIIFDSDDTIFYTRGMGLILLKKICEEKNIKLDIEKYYSLTGMSRTDKAKILFGENNAVWKGWNKSYEDNYEKYVIDLPDALKTIKKIHSKGIKLFIFSTKYSFLIKQALEKFKVKDLFEEIIGGEVTPKKPESEKIKHIFEKYGLKKEEVILVGDSKVDAKSAKNIGVDFIQINYLTKESLPSAKKEIFNLKEILKEI